MVVSTKDFEFFLNKVNSGFNGFSEVIVPYKVKSSQNKPVTLQFEKLKKESQILLNSFRTIDPTKILFYLTREKVYPVEGVIKKRVIVGVKACDLKALHLLDKAMLQSGFVDPAYKKWRDSSIIISSDCDHLHETCSCNLVNGHPYPESGFDLNLSVVDGNYFIEIGSERCQEFIELMKKEISVGNSTASDLEIVKSNRQNIFNQLCKKNDHLEHSGDYSGFRKVIHKNWEEVSKECIGCGACTNICPTCYCLILNDESSVKEFVKVRSYDSCQLYGYARVAGGGTPRPKMTERFRNRYLCKFDYMWKNFGEIGCTGCGRCTEACAAKIDFREVVKNISSVAQTVS